MNASMLSCVRAASSRCKRGMPNDNRTAPIGEAIAAAARRTRTQVPGDAQLDRKRTSALLEEVPTPKPAAEMAAPVTLCVFVSLTGSTRSIEGYNDRSLQIAIGGSPTRYDSTTPYVVARIDVPDVATEPTMLEFTGALLPVLTSGDEFILSSFITPSPPPARGRSARQRCIRATPGTIGAGSTSRT